MNQKRIQNTNNEINSLNKEIDNNQNKIDSLTSQIISKLHSNNVQESTINNIPNILDNVLPSIINISNNNNEIRQTLEDNTLNYLCDEYIIECMKNIIPYKNKIHQLNEDKKQKMIELSKL